VKLGPLEKIIKKRLTSVEIKFFRRTAGYNFLTTQGMKKVGGIENRTS
jgi:hypothetical protein